MKNVENQHWLFKIIAMRKIALIIALILGFSISHAETLEQKAFVDEDGSIFSDSDFEEGKDYQKNEYTDKLLYLDAVQKHFWNPNRKPKDNTLNITHRDGETYKIRTRFAMVTTIIIDNDRIADLIVGDSEGFEVKELGKTNNKWDLSNIVTVKPKLIGIDSNLTIIGESGTIYSFYLFSTHYTNRRDPAFNVFVSKQREIGRIPVKQHKNATFINKANKDNGYVSGAWNDDIDERKIPFATIEQDDGEFITIGDNVNTLHIDKTKIKRGYAQKPRAIRSWKTLWFKPQQTEAAISMMAIDIFHDNDYTYFKFDRENADYKFPVLFKVVDGFDNPVNTRIVGNYIIAEDLAEKWTLRIGDEYVCVQRIQKPLVIKEKEYVNVPAENVIVNQSSQSSNDSLDSNEKLIKEKEQKLKALEKAQKEAERKEKEKKEATKAAKEKPKDTQKPKDLFENIQAESKEQTSINAEKSKKNENK